MRSIIVEPGSLIMVRIGADRVVSPCRIQELRRNIPCSQDAEEDDGNKHCPNQDQSVIAAPEMPLQRHLPHLTSNDARITVLVT